MISLSHEFVHIHVNKAGGTSITEGLAECEDVTLKNYDHASACQIKRLIGQELWDEFYTFGNIRNPGSRLVSSYEYRRQLLEVSPSSKAAKEMGFEQWVRTFVVRHLSSTEFSPCVNMLKEDGKIIVSDVFFFEDLARSFEEIKANIRARTGAVIDRNLPSSNRTEKPPWKSYYSSKWLVGFLTNQFLADYEFAENVGKPYEVPE